MRSRKSLLVVGVVTATLIGISVVAAITLSHNKARKISPQELDEPILYEVERPQ